MRAGRPASSGGCHTGSTFKLLWPGRQNDVPDLSTSRMPQECPLARPGSLAGHGGRGAVIPDRLTLVAAADHRDELVDRVLVRRQRARPGVRRREPALHGLTGLPVLPVGDVPEV